LTTYNSLFSGSEILLMKNSAGLRRSSPGEWKVWERQRFAPEEKAMNKIDSGAFHSVTWEVKLTLAYQDRWCIRYLDTTIVG
jgi:hypothetical protein